MNRGKIVAIITGVISILLAVAYLLIVQILDFRGEMKPAPMTQVETHSLIASHNYIKSS
ncbi:MAG: glucose-inhibited division protein A [Richelia sp. RM2_1_2]|nr:glucose-inhibited division protein A [Richelia sp. SM2_1_7]NJM20636.1 glucose-inhibited division protein A [Richelia sp. SM1_7_0]NJN08691.1 glucose-inhibited division protein A [Richelia sp. RM1_1_1]NJO27904.1 glucose-inhibited division protein A [Richelia sp. SL_2_1]NJO58374.1 glucose-inhibited division protein A [Richelia sp. RM2_1_2]